MRLVLSTLVAVLALIGGATPPPVQADERLDYYIEDPSVSDLSGRPWNSSRIFAAVDAVVPRPPPSTPLQMASLDLEMFVVG